MFTRTEFERACALMQASQLSDYELDEQLAISFAVLGHEYSITFRLPGDYSLLMPSSPRIPGIEFVFRCNAIAFHPASTSAHYMIAFLESNGRLKTPRVLIVGEAGSIRRLLTYSIPGTESDGEIEFPKQI